MLNDAMKNTYVPQLEGAMFEGEPLPTPSPIEWYAPVLLPSATTLDDCQVSRWFGVEGELGAQIFEEVEGI